MIGTRLLIIAILIKFTRADPTPNGGMVCDENPKVTQCLGGICLLDVKNNTYEKTCACFVEYGNVDCSYHRKQRSYVGWMQIGLSFIMINGVGNFMLGYVGKAAGQLVLGLFMIMCIIPMLCCTICGAIGSGDSKLIANTVNKIITCVMCICVMSGFIWSLVDGVWILSGESVDANGYSLY